MRNRIPRWGWEVIVLVGLLAALGAYGIRDAAVEANTNAEQIRGCERGQVMRDVLHDFLMDAASIRLQSAATIRDQKGREAEAIQNEQIAQSYLQGAHRIQAVTPASCEAEYR